MFKTRNYSIMGIKGEFIMSNFKQTLRLQNEVCNQNKKQALKDAEKHIRNIIDSKILKDFADEFNNQFASLSVKNVKEFIVNEIKNGNESFNSGNTIEKSRYSFRGELYLSGLSTTWKMLVNAEILQAYSELELLTENKIKVVKKFEKYFPLCKFNDLDKLKSAIPDKDNKIKMQISAQLSEPLPELFQRLQVSNNVKMFLQELMNELKSEGITPSLLQYTRNSKYLKCERFGPTFRELSTGQRTMADVYEHVYYDSKHDYNLENIVRKSIHETEIAFYTTGFTRPNLEEERHFGGFSDTKLKKFIPVSKWQRPQENKWLRPKKNEHLKPPVIILRFKCTF